MRKQSLQDQRLDWLLPLALKQTQDEPAVRMSSSATPMPTADDLLRVDRAFQAAMKTCCQPSGFRSASSDASMQRSEKT